MARQTKPKIGDFEKSLKELETIVERMEQGEQSLEASLKDFERGMALVDACNNALTTNTWRGYKSAKKNLADCAAYTGTRMTFPMAENQVLCLIAYLYAVPYVGWL